MPGLPRPSLPKVNLPSVSVSLPDPVRKVLAVVVVAAAFFGPHTWLLAQAVTDAAPFGQVPIGQLPDLGEFAPERSDDDTTEAPTGEPTATPAGQGGASPTPGCDGGTDGEDCEGA